MSLLSVHEQQKLRAYGLAVYRDRIIVDARPPATADQITEVEGRLTGPIPSALRALWGVTFGGRLEYDLTADFDGYRLMPLFRELFYPHSDHCLDLLGWIDEELELTRRRAEQSGAPVPDKLDFIPIGGFDEVQRVCIEVSGPNPGRVWLWVQGLPWTSGTFDEALTEIADDLDDLFDQLCLYDDPFAGTSDRSMVGAVRRMANDDPELAARVEDLIRSSIFDWETIVGRGPFSGADEQARAGRLALLRAATADDVALLEQLIAHRYPLDVIVAGADSALTFAIAGGALRFGKHLLDACLPLGDAPIHTISVASAHLVDRCIDAEVGFRVEAPIGLAEAGKVDAALRVAGSARRHGDWTGLESAVRARAAYAERHAAALRAQSGRLTVTIDNYESRAQSLKRFLHGLRELG